MSFFSFLWESNKKWTSPPTVPIIPFVSQKGGRPMIFPPVEPETTSMFVKKQRSASPGRYDSEAKSASKKSQGHDARIKSPERGPVHIDSRSEDHGERREAERRDAPNAVDEGKSFFAADKRQRRIVYNSFGEYPGTVLKTVVEDIPEPASDKDVVIKIAVGYFP